MVVVDAERWNSMRGRWDRTLAELYGGEPKQPEPFTAVVVPMSEETFGALGLAEQVLVVDVLRKFPTLDEAELLAMLRTV